VSINKFQEKIFRTGCGSAVLFVCAGVFLGGMFYAGCGLGGRTNNQAQDQERTVAVKVGDNPIYAEDLGKMMDNARQNALQRSQVGGPDALPPSQEAYDSAMVINEALEGVGYLYLAKKAGATFSDDSIRKVEMADFESKVLQTKMALQTQKLLKPNATDKEFDEVLKKQAGGTLAELKKQFNTSVETNLKDPKIRPTMESSIAKKVLGDTLEAKSKPSDAEVKASYDSYVFKRILFSMDPDADNQIKKALADIKGGLTFEQAMDRYSKEPGTAKGKKASDSTTEINAPQFDAIPDYAPLKTLKPGEVSGVVNSPQGKAIYKLITVKSTVPPDFDKKKSDYIKDFVHIKIGREVDNQMKDLLSSGLVKWENPGFKALFDWYRVTNDFSPSNTPDAQRNKLTAVIADARKALNGKGSDSRAALLAWFGSVDRMWGMAITPADKDKLRPDRIEVIRAVTASTPYFSLKMELVDLLIDNKATKEAGVALVDAATSNLTYDSTGQRNFQDINAKLEKLKGLKLISPDQEKAIQKAQDDWQKQSQEIEDEKAKAKAAQAEAKRQADELAAQQKAEFEKAKAKNKGAAPATAPGKAASDAKAPAGTPAPASNPPAKKP